MNTPNNNQYPSPSSKKRRIDEDDNVGPRSLATKKSAVSGKHQQQQRRYGPLSMEPCSISRLEHHISLLQSEVEEYQELINKKLNEIEHAKYRVEYLRNTKTDISVFKQHIRNAIAKAFDTNAATATERLDDPTSLQEIKEELLGEIDNVNFKDDSEDTTDSSESAAEDDVTDQTVHIPGQDESRRGSSFSSIPESFVFPGWPTRLDGWRNWLLGSILVEDDKRCMIKPYRLISMRELQTKELKTAYKLNWKPIFTIMMNAPGVVTPPNYEDIDEDFVKTSFAIATEHLKEQYAYIFQTPENKRDLWSLSTWSKKVLPSQVRMNGTPADIEKLSLAAVIKSPRKRNEPVAKGDGHVMRPADPSRRDNCVVCKLEEVWRKEANLKDARGESSRCQTHMAECSHPDCMMCAHSMPMGNDRKILMMDCFRGKSCFDILHSEECRGLWNAYAGETLVRGDKLVRHPSYSVNRSHRIYRELASMYGRGLEQRRKKSACIM